MEPNSPKPALEEPTLSSTPPDVGAPQGGIPDGSPLGVLVGNADGVPGGALGGEPRGNVGGCVGCNGDGAVSDWDQGPRILFQSRPVYPPKAFVEKIQGTVLLEILIDETGQVVATRLLRSVSADLEQAATQAVRQWRFAPARKGGRPVAVWAKAPVQFTIH